MKLLRHLYFSFIYIADDRFDYIEKAVMYFKLLLAIGPIAYVLNIAGFWFDENKKFVTFFILIVVVNASLGLWKHKKTNEFNYEEFFVKTGMMLVVVIVTYFLLSMVGSIAGDNFISEGFEVSIQVMTLMYPASKGLKSIFVISNGEYPPKWIMKKVYNFENEGDINDLFGKPKKEEYDEE